MDNARNKFYPATIGWQDDCFEKNHCRCQNVEKSFCLPGLTCVQNIGVSYTDVRHCPCSDFFVVSYEITVWYEACKQSCNCDCKHRCCTAIERGSVVFRDLPFDADCDNIIVPLPSCLCHKERCGEVTVCFMVKLCEKKD